MQKTETGNVVIYSDLTEDQYTAGLLVVRSFGMGHGFGQNEERGFYIEVMPEGRTPERIEAVEAALA